MLFPVWAGISGCWLVLFLGRFTVAMCDMNFSEQIIALWHYRWQRSLAPAVQHDNWSYFLPCSVSIGMGDHLQQGIQLQYLNQPLRPTQTTTLIRTQMSTSHSPAMVALSSWEGNHMSSIDQPCITDYRGLV